MPVIQAWKRRDTATGKLTGFDFDQFAMSRIAEDVIAPRFLVVDDLCDGGGTFIGLATEINYTMEERINLDLYVTHGLFSKGTTDLLKLYEIIYTTDSTLAAESAQNVELIKIL